MRRLQLFRTSNHNLWPPKTEIEIENAEKEQEKEKEKKRKEEEPARVAREQLVAVASGMWQVATGRWQVASGTQSPT